jgi:hypothetical protein
MSPVTSRAAVLIVSALVISGCAGTQSAGGTAGASTPSPAQPTASVVQPSASAAWETSTSDRHGYSISHPADWRVVPQPGTLVLEQMRIGSPGTDTLGSRDNFRYNSDDGVVVLFSVELEEGESFADFNERVSWAYACGGGGSRREETQLGGEVAESSMHSCGQYQWIQITTIHGDRGFVVWLVTTSSPGPEERPLNDELLATFSFIE